MNRPSAKPCVPWRALIGAAAAVVAALSTPLAQAQNAGAYPAKPIRLVVPFAAGGSTDILGRLLAQKLGESMQVAVVVDNKPGANGTIGCDQVAKAPPDGYTVVLGEVGCMGMAPGLYPKLPYDPLRDFAPISLVGRSPMVFTVAAQSPFKSVGDVTAAAKAQPDKLNYPSSGVGGPNHLGSELYAMQTGTKINHIPYKGSAPAIVSLMAGETDFAFLTAVTMDAQLRAGKLRALAVAHSERLPSMPNVPTMAEAGLKGFTAESWYLAAVPAGTPKPIVDRLYAEIAKALPSPDVKAKLDSTGVLPAGLSPEASGQFLRAEVDKWRAVIKTAGITLD